MSVKYISPYVEAQTNNFNFIDDLSDGWSSIVNKKSIYLPKEHNEDDKSYKARHTKALYEDSFNTTINGLTGLIFKKEIIYNDDIPTQLKPMIENADMQGNHFDILIEKLFDGAIRKGISFALIDIPNVENIQNKADEIKNNIRPFITLIDPKNVTSWKTKNINGQIILSQVKIREYIQIEDDKNPYALKTVEQYRVLEVGTYRIIRNTQENEKIIEDGYTYLNYIPLVALNLNAKGFFESFPPFFDLGKLNIAHYQIQSDLNYSNHIANVPILKMLGFDAEEVKNITISVNKAIISTNESAKLEWLSWDGAGAENSERMLNRIEKKMLDYGLSVISSDTATTATEINISTNQSQSKLNKWIRLLIDSIQIILKHSAGFYGLNEGGSISIDADILSQPLDASQVATLNNMVLSGTMSLDTMYKMIGSENFKLPNNFDIEAEHELIGSDGLLKDT